MTRGRAAIAALGIAMAACRSPEAGPRGGDPRAVVTSGVRQALSHRDEVRVLVTARDRRGVRAIEALLEGARSFDSVPVVSGSLNAAQLPALERSPSVRVVTLDEGGRAHLLESLALARFPPVEAAGWSGEGVTVAVMDTGIDRSHPALSDAVIDEVCFCSTGCCPGGTTQASGAGSADDDSGHGTHVAGIIAARGGAEGPRGGAPGVELISIKVLDEDEAFCCASDLVAAFDWLISAHPEVDIVNMSFGANGLFGGDCDGEDVLSPLAAAATALLDRGVLLVASSGNNGDPGGLPAPACLRDVISVGAVWDDDIGPEAILCEEPMTSADRIACFSNASATLDLLAPGALVISTWPAGLTRGRVGTSQAAPMAAACAALLRQAHPGAGIAELTAALRSSATTLNDSRNGHSYPRLDCSMALRALEPPGDEDGGREGDGGLDGSTAELDGSTAELDAGATADAGAGNRDAGHASGPDAALAPDASIGVDAATEDSGTQAPGAFDASIAADAQTIPEADAAQDTVRARPASCDCDATGAGDGRGGRTALLASLTLLLRSRRRRARDSARGA